MKDIKAIRRALYPLSQLLEDSDVHFSGRAVFSPTQTMEA
jgi:hypothetical protein